MSPKYLLAVMGASILLLQAPIVFGCVDFVAYCYPDPKHAAYNLVKIGLLDNNVVVCTGDGNPNDKDGKRFDLTCKSGFASIFDPDSGNVLYSNGGSHYEFGTDYLSINHGDAGDIACQWTACVFGCNPSTDCTHYWP